MEAIDNFLQVFKLYNLRLMLLQTEMNFVLECQNLFDDGVAFSRTLLSFSYLTVNFVFQFTQLEVRTTFPGGTVG